MESASHPRTDAHVGRTALLIAAATVVVHGALIFNDGVYWDGHIIYTWIQQRDWAGLRSSFADAGAPARAVIHVALGHLPHFVLAYKVSAFVAILALAIGVWRVAVDSGWLTNVEGAWVAVLAMAYPGYALHVELILIPRVIAYACFIWAVWIGLRAGRSRAPTALALHAIASVMFVASFILPSFITLYLGYVWLAAVSSTRRVIDVAAWTVPLLAGVVGLWLWRPSGTYTGYDQVSLSIGQAATETLWFTRYAVYGAINTAFTTLLSQPLLAVAALAVAAYGFGRVPSGHLWKARGSTFAFALALLALAIGPYAVVGKHPLVGGWTSRHSQLVGLPLALAIVAAASMAGRRGWLPGIARDLALTTVAVAFGLSMMASYVSWQARWVKDASVMANLASRSGAGRYSIFLLDDQFPVGPESGYRNYEWSSMFRRVWGDERHTVAYGEPSVDAIAATLAGPGVRQLNLGDVDPWGCQASLAIRRGRMASDDLTMALTYTYTRIVHPARLGPYLSDVTALDITPHPSAGATHCRQP